MQNQNTPKITQYETNHYPVQLLLLVITCFLFIDCHVKAESGVYVGGHIRRERPNTITKLKTPVLLTLFCLM